MILSAITTNNQLDWKLVVALMENESNPNANPNARKFDPLQVANDGDAALTAFRTAISSPTDRRLAIAAPGDLIATAQKIGHTPSDVNGRWVYDNGTVEGGSFRIIDYQTSIRMGILWLLTRKAETNEQARIINWDLPWFKAVQAYNNADDVTEAYAKDIYNNRYPLITKEYQEYFEQKMK